MFFYFVLKKYTEESQLVHRELFGQFATLNTTAKEWSLRCKSGGSNVEDKEFKDEELQILLDQQDQHRRQKQLANHWVLHDFNIGAYERNFGPVNVKESLGPWPIIHF